MNGKILIGSLQFSPIYKSHCCALGNQCEMRGLSVRYMFSQEYEWMLPDAVRQKATFIGRSTGLRSTLVDGLNVKLRRSLAELIDSEKPDYIYMYNFHPFFNGHIAKCAKRRGSTFIQHVHEPYVVDKSVYGGLAQYWLYAFELFQEMLFNDTDTVVLSSDVARDLFRRRYKKYSGRMLSIPLMYEDIGNPSVPLPDRRYVTFVGPLLPAKGPETFYDMMVEAEDQNPGLEFLLITRKRVIDRRFLDRKNLSIYYRDRITDAEMMDLFSHSVSTLAPYKVATQSSVVLTSFMNGTPVVAAQIKGLSEEILHLDNGYLIDPDTPADEWISGIEHVTGDFPSMSRRCRSSFEEKFSEKNWPKYFSRLFEGSGDV